jgi:serine protease Do
MTVAELSDDLRTDSTSLPEVRGVVITEVEPGSAAEERGISAGEVITEIAQESVSTPEQVTERIAALRNQGRRNALLMLSNGRASCAS